jgi:hypothetical protein
MIYFLLSLLAVPAAGSWKLSCRLFAPHPGRHLNREITRCVAHHVRRTAEAVT